MNSATETQILGFGEMVDVYLDSMADFSWLVMPFGGILLAISVVMAIRRVLIGHYEASWSSVVSPLILGIFALTLGGKLKSRSQKPEPGPLDVASPPPELKEPGSLKGPPEPIVLPEIHNLEVLWLMPLAIGTVLGLYLFVKKVRGDIKARESAEHQRQQLESLLANRWEAVKVRHQELDRKFLSTETDWDILFSYPTLQDTTVPQTSAMVRAMVKAARLDQRQPSTLTENSDLERYPYPRAVAEFAHTLHVAFEHAKKVGQKRIPPAERRIIAQIRQMLTLAENAGATANERNLAYSRARKLIGSLQTLRLPDKALHRLEGQQRLAIGS